MKNTDDFPWKFAKKKLAEQFKEITLVKNCSFKYRNDLVSQGIYSYDKLTDNKMISNTENFINNNKLSIQKHPNILFVDFEILTSIYDDFSSFPASNDKEYIFNIGCGLGKDRNFIFKSYMAYTLSEEYDILCKFIEFINSIPGDDVLIVHWTNIEKRLLLKKIKEYDLYLNKEILWLDLHNYFVESDILIKNCFSYKLKSVSKSLFSSGLIESSWDDSFMDGLGAMTGYLKYLSSNDADLIRDIAHYNMIDCKVLWEIYSLIKN
jgi:predicted RecB family nuclease